MPNEQQWVAFRLAGQAFGLPIAAVREIVRAPEMTPIPQSPEYLAGVTNLRGRIIPVVDLRKKLGIQEPGSDGSCSVLRVPAGEPLRDTEQETRRVEIPNSARSSKGRVLVLAVEGKLMGLLVDEASEVLKIAPADVDPNPNLFGDGGESYVSGIARHQGKLVVLLKPEKLLARHES